MIPVYAIGLCCLCGPTVLAFLIPIIMCKQRVPLTSIVMNLITNVCFTFFIYGLYLSSGEETWDFDSPETISIVMAVLIVLSFLLFRFRVLALTCCNEIDSIAYIPSMTKFSIIDFYELMDYLLKLRSRPPMIKLVGHGSNVIPDEDEDPANNAKIYEAGNLVGEKWVNYGSWKDETDPIILKKAYILNIKISIKYSVENTLRLAIEREKASYEEEIKRIDPFSHVDIVYTNPGYTHQLMATTRGAIPSFVDWMHTVGGRRMRDFLMFFGYHSILEAIWVCMIKNQTIKIKKHLNDLIPPDHTPMGLSEYIDYHNIPIVK